MAQACTPTIITLSGCPHCANLESMLNNAQIKYTVDMSQACQCYPCAVLCDGSHVTSCGGNAENDVFAAIQKSIAATTTKTSTTAPLSTTTTTPASAASVTTTPAWRTTKWSNALSVDWGAKNPLPTIAQTAAGYEPPDVSLTPVLPVPVPQAAGLTVALMDHKKMPIARKVA